MKNKAKYLFFLSFCYIGFSIGVNAQQPKSLLAISHDMGFLEARFDSVMTDEGIIDLRLIRGISYYWDKLSFCFDPDLEWSAKSRKLLPVNGDKFRMDRFEEFLQVVLISYENQGYPFVRVYLSDISINKGAVSAILSVDRGVRIRIDSIISRTSDVISPKVLSRLTGLSAGDWYNQKLLEDTQQRLMSTGYLKTDRALEAGFFDDKAWVYITPLKQPSNRFDALIGFAPGGLSRSIININGHLDLSLVNLLRQGESFSFNWQAPGSGTQRLISQIVVPYLMGWPVGLSGGVELYKRDTSYLTVETDLGLRVSFMPDHWIDLQMLKRSSHGLASVSSSELQEFNLSIVRLSYNLDKRMPKIFPRSGWFLQPRIGIGKKQITTEDSGLSSLNHWEAEINMGLFIPIGWQLALSVTGHGGYRSGSNLADNEKFRLGGYSILRGFQEESLLADLYLISTAEFLLYLSEASNLHVFSDFGYLQNMSLNSHDYFFPVSIGMGVQLQTRAGLLNLDYAIGSSRDQIFSIQNGFIHLGIKSIF